MSSILEADRSLSPALLKESKSESKGPKNILFVCSGNTCRSPMAAALFNHRFSKYEMKALSRGLFASGGPISENAVEALKRYGVEETPDNNYSLHVSANVDSDILEEADLVVAMTSRHALSLIISFPQFASKVTSFANDIPDPFGQDVDTYIKCLSKIDEELTKIFCSNG